MPKSIFLCLANFIDNNRDNYLRLIKKEKKKLTKDSVHDIRVTTRKLDACLELLKTLGFRHKKLEKNLHHIRKIHSPLRNIDVELDTIKNYENQFRLKSLKKHLKKTEQKNKHKILIDLNQISLKKLDREIQKAIDKTLKKENSNQNLKAIHSLATQHQKNLAKFEKIKKTYSQKSLKSIHAIRIAAKKLRYQMEILKPVIHIDDKKLFHMKHLQEMLGEIQNNNVLQKSIKKFLHKNSNKSRKSVLAFKEIMIKRQEEIFARIGKMKNLKLEGK